MTVNFKLIKADKDISEKDGFGVTVISSVLLAILVVYLAKETEVPRYLVLLVVLAYFLFGRSQIRKLFSDWVKKDDIIGTLEFNNEEFLTTSLTKHEKLKYEDVASIFLHYNYIKGKQFAVKDIIHNGLAEIKINTKTGEHYIFKFLIENKNQIADLKPIWKQLYLSGVLIREKMGKYEVKTIMFDGKLTDDKIKSYKKDLNVTSFY